MTLQDHLNELRSDIERAYEKCEGGVYEGSLGHRVISAIAELEEAIHEYESAE